MLDRESAESVALRYLRVLEAETGIRLTLCDSLTRATHGGWLFFYDSLAHAVQGGASGAIAGNAPFLVRSESEILITGTARPVEAYLENLGELKREIVAAE